MKTILLTMMAGLILVGCTGTTAVKEGTQIGEKPDWVQTLGRYEKGIGAVGIAPFSKGGTQIQLDEALLAARTQLTQIIETRVQGSISTTATRLRETGLGTGEELTTLQTQVVRNSLIDKSMKKSYQIKQWRDRENGELYVWAVMEREDLTKLSNTLAESLVKKKLNESAADHQKKLEMMREELRKQLN